jgi:hypothetical protein
MKINKFELPAFEHVIEKGSITFAYEILMNFGFLSLAEKTMGEITAR